MRRVYNKIKTPLWVALWVLNAVIGLLALYASKGFWWFGLDHARWFAGVYAEFYDPIQTCFAFSGFFTASHALLFIGVQLSQAKEDSPTT